jgi:SAM-dependent methyltransferase
MQFDEKYFKEHISSTHPRMKEATYRGFLSFLGAKPRKEYLALDIGCGYGHACKLLRELDCSVYGVDISSHAVVTAKKLLGNRVDLLVCDLQESLPFRINFDFVSCFDVLEHIKNPKLALDHIFSVLKEGGTFVASTPNPASRSLWAGAYTDPTHISLKCAKEWRGILQSCGFSHIQIRIAHFIPFIWRIVGRLTLIETRENIGTFILMKASKYTLKESARSPSKRIKRFQ